MARRTLTEKPRVPLLVHAAMAGALAASPLGCGDDASGDTSNSSDVAPTAGPCYHDGGNTPECMTTGLDGGSLTNGSTSMATTGPATTFDTAPTAGPCAHDDGNLPECMTTSGPSDSSGTGTAGSGTGTGGGTTGTGAGTSG